MERLTGVTDYDILLVMISWLVVTCCSRGWLEWFITCWRWWYLDTMIIGDNLLGCSLRLIDILLILIVLGGFCMSWCWWYLEKEGKYWYLGGNDALRDTLEVKLMLVISLEWYLDRVVDNMVCYLSGIIIHANCVEVFFMLMISFVSNLLMAKLVLLVS